MQVDVRDAGWIPELRRSPGGGHGNPLQYSCLENPKDRGAWQATNHGVAKSQTRLSDWIPMFCSTRNINYVMKLTTLQNKKLWSRMSLFYIFANFFNFIEDMSCNLWKIPGYFCKSVKMKRANNALTWLGKLFWPQRLPGRSSDPWAPWTRLWKSHV